MNSINSIPNSVNNFIKNKKKNVSWIIGSVGLVYFGSQWVLNKLTESAERSSLELRDKENLTRRFNLNLQDCHFTVLALLPSLSSQIFSNMNVEAVSAELAILVAKEKREELERSKSLELIPIPHASTSTAASDDPEDEPLEPLKPTISIPIPKDISSSLSLNPTALEFVPSSPLMPSSPTITITPPPLDEDISTQKVEKDLSESWDQVVMNDDVSEGESISTPSTNESKAEEPTRAELWNEIKILSFTRAITSLYTLSLLTIQTHIQLNLIGQVSYATSVNASLPLSSSHNLPSTTSLQLTQELECMYLTFSWWLLHRGWKVIAIRVRSAVEEVLGPLQLKSPIIYGELSGLLGQIRNKIDFNSDGTAFSFISCVSPQTLEEELETLASGGINLPSSNIPTELRFLLDETSDIFESLDSALVQKRLLDSLFSQLLGALELPFRHQGRGVTREQGSRFEDITERTTKLANLLPTMTRQSHLILNGLPNEYFDNLSELSELRDLSTILYSTFATQTL